MNGSKSDPFPLTVKGCQHHVARVQRVNKIWRESVALLHYVRTTITKLRNEEMGSGKTLKKSPLYIPSLVVRIFVVRLNNRKPNWGNPFDIFSRDGGNQFGAFREPILNFFCRCEHLLKTLKGFVRQIRSSKTNLLRRQFWKFCFANLQIFNTTAKGGGD